MAIFVLTGSLVLLALSAVSGRDPNCAKTLKADIYFLSDSSTSISPDAWQKSLNFVVDTAKEFKLGPGDVQCAFGIFSTKMNHIINLNQFTTQTDFATKVLSTVQLEHDTHTYTALETIGDQGLLTSAEKGARPNVPKILIITTDGQSQSMEQTIAAAEELWEKNVTIFSIGVDVTNKAELIGMSGNEKYVFSVDNFDALDAIRKEITEILCEAKTPPLRARICPPAKIIDMFALVDASGSIGLEKYKFNFQFLKKLLEGFTLSTTGTKVALTTFSTTVQSQFNLSSDKAFVEKFLDNVPYENANTNTDLGLLWVIESGVNTPALGARTNAQKVLILVTDGESSFPPKTIAAAAKVKGQGITIIVVAVGHAAFLTEPNSIASTPNHVIQVVDYNNLDYAVRKVSELACV